MPAEMTATGEIVDGKPHIHAVMAVQGDRTIGGHLHKAHLGTSFARATVQKEEMNYRREPPAGGGTTMIPNPTRTTGTRGW
jgi:predicted DNA-binding protein with PD1-like motif